MDHVYNAIRSFYEVYLQEFLDCHKTGKYKKLDDNPCYKEVKSILDSMNIIRKHLGWETLKLSEEVVIGLDNLMDQEKTNQRLVEGFDLEDDELEI